MGGASPGCEFGFKLAAFGAGPIIDFVGEEDVLDGTGFLGGETGPGGNRCIQQGGSLFLWTHGTRRITDNRRAGRNVTRDHCAHADDCPTPYD